MIRVAAGDVDAWRGHARRLLQAGTPPEAVVWVDDGSPQSALPLGVDAPDEEREDRGPQPRVSRRFMELARLAACHRDETRWTLLYRVLWRLQHENRRLLDVASDPDVLALDALAAQVRRDEHKMRAFVRFTRVQDDGGERFVAYYAPDHHIVRLAAPFFADRFAAMRWSVLTPDLSAHWDGRALTFTEGVAAPPRDTETDVEGLWKTYYAAVFNPARLNLRATLREMPLRRWKGLPEASLIPSLAHSAHERTRGLPKSDAASARPFVPDTRELGALRAAAAGCAGCDLFRSATHVVFGEGPRDARLVLVGEQPGDAEDLAGRPFVGPAGEVLDRALAAAGIDRGTVYVTNAVKHFSFEERGKRRIHKTPRMSEVRACRPWLEAELQALAPERIVCLGATAARALLGPQARVGESRGRLITGTPWASSVVVTVHPSAVLRADDGESYFSMLVSDLTLAARS